MGTASLCLEVYFNLHALSCVLEDLLGSWPVFIEIKGYNKILQYSKEPASWPGTELCSNTCMKGPGTSCQPKKREKCCCH